MHSRSGQLLIALAAFLGCLWGGWACGRTAASRLMVKYGMSTADASALDRAIRLTPTDAEGHYGKAALSSYLDEPVQALSELELAASLRPRDYAVWLDLGMMRDQLGDSDSALLALNESVRLAPFYSKPRWQRGNLLFRMGRYDDAIDDLRSAASSSPGLLPGLIDLAWGASGHDPLLTEQILQSQNDNAHLALAFFYANHGRPENALTQLGLAKNVAVEKRRDLVQALVAAGAYSEAFAVWRQGGDAGPLKEAIYDGGFERTLKFADASFGWVPVRGVASLILSMDQHDPHSGTNSLRIDFKGDSNPDLPIVRQLILVEPGTHYKLSFAARTRELVTGGPPIVVIRDETNKAAPKIASTAPLPVNSASWQTIVLEFQTGPTTKAVECALQREPCAGAPCPIFGSLNLDNFVLDRVSVQPKH